MSAVLVARGAIDTAPAALFICLLIGVSGVPAALGIGFIVNEQLLSVGRKRKIIALTIVVVAINAFAWMFWMMGYPASS